MILQEQFRLTMSCSNIHCSNNLYNFGVYTTFSVVGITLLVIGILGLKNTIPMSPLCGKILIVSGFAFIGAIFKTIIRNHC